MNERFDGRRTQLLEGRADAAQLSLQTRHASAIGDAGPRPTARLRLEDASGRPFDAREALKAHWHRPPYAMAIRLVERGGDGVISAILDEAVIGTRGRREELADRIASSTARMWRRANAGTAPGPGGATLPPALRPGWLASIRAGFDYFTSRLRDKLLSEWWSIGSARALPADLVSGQGLGKVCWAEPRKGSTYLADPFAWSGTGRLLAEEMPVAGGRGRIVALHPRADGRLSRREVVLQDDLHHSYPCIFRDNGVTYLLPEAPVRGRTMVYRLGEDAQLSIVCAVAPGRAMADPTLFRWAGRYWIAFTDLDVGAHDNLCLLHAEHLAGPWRAHRCDPVRIDIRGARCAGTVFEVGAHLYRPGQDCARSYGAAVVIHRIETLSPDVYRETPVAVLAPERDGPFPHGLHTLSIGEGCVWVDGKRMVLDLRLVGNRMAGKLRITKPKLGRGVSC